ncbi:hypothetical protein Hypma_001377 [Hypsizygus marmoreus]|uniref:MYND-type domain-containing protein n=1 Tax=Hypsizygus marmoreus TaxID=39966 RepID=A0A369K2M0_HYPMA|nr:hypothetical protein Hypma_001377 [Hypsizygus marmoreus]
MARVSAGSTVSQTPANLLLGAIRDPHDPRLCGTCLIGCLDAVFSQTQHDHFLFQRNLAKHHDIWNALILFVTVKRTNKQMQRLLTRLSHCSCRLADPQICNLHERGEKLKPFLIARTVPELELQQHGTDLSGLSPTVSGSAFPTDIFALFGENLPVARIKSVAKGSTASWPSSPSELLPLGADAFVEAMLQWHDVLQDTLVFVTVAVALRICRSVLLPSVISHSLCGRLVKAGRSLFDRTIAHVVLNDFSPAGYRAGDHFFMQLEGIQILLGVIQEQPTDGTVAFFRGYETKVCQLCSLFLHVLTDPRYPHPRKGALREQFHGIKICGEYLYRTFHMHLPPRPPIPLHPDIVEFDEQFFPPDPSIRSLEEVVICTINSFREESRCAGLHCDDSLQTVGKGFSRCARCNVVTYCGRECQAQDWRNQSFPHKMVCPKLRTVIAQGGGWTVFSQGDMIETIPIIRENWKASGVDESDLEYINGWRKDRETRRSKMPDGTEWAPAFDDYDSIVWQFGASGAGPKPRYPDRLARWPSEVAEEKALLEVQPFWEQDVD